MDRARKLAGRAILRRLISQSRPTPISTTTTFNFAGPHRHQQARSVSVESLRPTDTFPRRHNSATPSDQSEMSGSLGFPSLDHLIDATVPKSIRAGSMTLPIFDSGLTESQMLSHMQQHLASRNKLYKSFIGMGYSNTFVPAVVILRNIMENPGWYTQYYTPYQAEIAQGRLESLLNFQTTISDLTALPMSNASLLDEGTTAAAEAMAIHSSIS